MRLPRPLASLCTALVREAVRHRTLVVGGGGVDFVDCADPELDKTLNRKPRLWEGPLGCKVQDLL